MTGIFDDRRATVPGLFVLSGLDGTGKSTQASLLARRLEEEGFAASTIWNRWEPGITRPLVRLARKAISRKPDAATAEYETFTAGKRRRMRSPLRRLLWQAMVWGEYAVQVRRRLRRAKLGRKVVICDRFVYDTLVDIAVNFSLDPNEIDRLCAHPLLAAFPRPSLVFVIDIDPETGSRRKNDGTPAAYLADRRELYLAVARRAGAIVVDGNRSVDEVASAIWAGAAGAVSTLPPRLAKGSDRA